MESTGIETHFKLSLNNNNILTYQQRQFYEDNGFLLINKFIEDELLDKCQQRFIDICNGDVPKGAMTLMKDVSYINNEDLKKEAVCYKLQEITYDEVFEQYVMNQKLLNYVESFIGPNIKCINSMLINKPPDANTLTSRHPLHQDLHYFPFRPAHKIIATWTAMERVTPENGCLVLIPGSHKGELLRHDYPEWEIGANKGFHEVKEYGDQPTIPIIMDKGDTVFFHPLLIHGSGANLTKGFRKAISGHYAASDCHYIDVTGTTQENIGREIEEVYRKKGYSNVSFAKFWKMRNRLVRGHELKSLL